MDLQGSFVVAGSIDGGGLLAIESRRERFSKAGMPVPAFLRTHPSAGD